MRRLCVAVFLAVLLPRPASAGPADPPSVFAVYTAEGATGQAPACWVCRIAEVGTLACPGTLLVPEADWDAPGLAGLAGCAAVRRNQCGELKNFDCGNALQAGRRK